MRQTAFITNIGLGCLVCSIPYKWLYIPANDPAALLKR
jgi:hypothetical protein